jgi:uncharacterized protein YlzI (FlbEa/FlbD family)
MGKLSWSQLVTEIMKKSGDVYMYCSACSSATQCAELLEIATPIEIKILNGCCACLIQILIEKFTELPTLFIQSIVGEDEVVYILSDVLLDISENGITIIPKEKVDEYLEYLKEFDEEKAKKVKQFIDSLQT